MSEQTEAWIHIRDSKCPRYITDVSNLGNVRYGGGQVCPSTMYQRVMVDRKITQISHLVAECFVPKTDEDIRLGRVLVDHKTHNPSDFNVNDYRNVRWCTNKENSNFSEAKNNMHKGMRGRARSEFGEWFNGIFPDGRFNRANEYAYYFRRYKETGVLPTTLDYSNTFKGVKSDFSRWYRNRYGKGSDNPVFYNKCRRHYVKTGEFLEV